MKDQRPNFEQHVIEPINDGYWLGTFDVDGDGRPDLVASGVEFGRLVWYKNPGWERHPMAELPEPVAWDYADFDSDGYIDAVVCHDFGGCPRACKPEDGKISWLRNPGAPGSGRQWEVRPVDELMATHRVKVGHFTQAGRLEVLAMPLVGPGDPHNPCPFTLYQRPDDVLSASKWAGTVIDDSHFSVVHDAVVGKFRKRIGSDLDSLLVCSAEGLTWLYFDDAAAAWRRVRLGTGQEHAFDGIFRGTGSVAVGRIGADPHAYLAASEPLHGPTVAVYTKDGADDLAGTRWRRTVLDVFGEPNAQGEGSVHQVVTGDFDGDGDDEFLVALRGPAPDEGVYYYKAAAEGGQLRFTKARVSSSSASIIATADFDGDGRLDFATIGYHTPGFFLAPDPNISVFYNRFGQPSTTTVPPSRDVK
jgi:FG-GAP-like repeat